MDFIEVRGGNNNTVDVAGDLADDTVSFFDSPDKTSKNNKVITSYGDDAGFRTSRSDTDISGAGTTSEESVSTTEPSFREKCLNYVAKGAKAFIELPVIIAKNTINEVKASLNN